MGKLFDTVVKHKFFSNKSSLKVKSCTIFYHKGTGYNLRKVPKGKKVRHHFFSKEVSGCGGLGSFMFLRNLK